MTASAPVDVLAIGVEAAIANCALYLREEAGLIAAAVAEVIDFAGSALTYVDEAAKAERERHRINGAAGSLVIAQEVADNLRAALARVGGAR